MSGNNTGYQLVKLSQTKDVYAGTDVPGEFRRFTDLLGGEQLAMTLIHIPPHSDFEQGTGHYHDEIEELYIITNGTLTMRFDDETRKVAAPAAVLVKPKTKRSHRNEGDEPVDMWAISPKLGRDDSHLIRVFWKASKLAAQKRR